MNYQNNAVAKAADDFARLRFKDIELTYCAWRKLCANLEAFGNRLHPEHSEALNQVLDGFTRLALGNRSGRYAYPLPCGGGKTQAIVAWCAAVHELDRPYTLLVCASQVQALCDLKNGLMVNGVPEEKIGLIHSYGDKAELPPTEGNNQRPFLLATHNGIRATEHYAKYHFGNGVRDLVIWDESLLVSNHFTISALSLDQSLGFLEPALKDKPSEDLQGVVSFSKDCLMKIQNELNGLEEGMASIISLPMVREHLQERYKIAAMNATSCFPRLYEPIVSLIDIAGNAVRIQKLNNGAGMIQYEIVVPKEFKNIAILDASFPFRLLEQADPTIKVDECFDGKIKRYDDVTVHHMKVGSGRSSIIKDFCGSKALMKDIVAVIQSIPETEAVLVFGFKSRKAESRGNKNAEDLNELLRRELIKAGIDLSAKVQTPEGLKDRFVWLTWGQETSLSIYSYAQNVVFVGVIYRPDLDLAGALVGQSNDLKRHVSGVDLRAVRMSEVSHSIYQAINRAACRLTLEGQAMQTKVWLPLWDVENVKVDLMDVMPGLQWCRWDSVKGLAKKTQRNLISERIMSELKELPSDIEKISTTQFKKETKLDEYNTRTFNKALDDIKDELPSIGWKHSGRSFTRQ